MYYLISKICGCQIRLPEEGSAMLMISIFFLTLIALLFLIFKKNKLAIMALILNLSTVILIGSGLLPDFLLHGLQSQPFLANPDWKSNNKIVLLAGGAVRRPDGHANTQTLAYPRLYETARLYFQCKKKTFQCSILISGGDVAGINISEATVMQAELVNLGIPAADIEVETKSRNTLENALFTSRILLKEKPDFTVLVTSGFHMGRAMLMFAHHGITALPAPADHLVVSSNLKQLYTNFFFTDVALHEYVGQLKFLISN